MTSLNELFTPSFLIFLGIIFFLVALLVIYFESKMREQNHKIASMLSLVSTLAEESNNLKHGLNHLAITLGGGPAIVVGKNNHFEQKNLGNNIAEENSNELIEVSDDESEEEDLEEEDELEEDLEVEEELELEEEIDEELDESEKENVKIIKLNMNQDDSETELGILDDLEEETDLDDIPEISKDYTEEILNLKYDDSNAISLEENINFASELKTISINLGDEPVSEQIDFKKLQLPKLRNIAIEKGLIISSEANKFKKPDLLKLLGAE
jgi:hypothetical protein